MAGIGHRGFMGRKKADNFRYLHDEISGGVFGVSHLKVKSAYSGDCVQLGGGSPTDFGFASNIIDLSLIDATYGSDQTVNIYYDQVGSNNLDTGVSLWVKSDNELVQHDGQTGKNNVSTSAALASLSGAHTIIQVIKHNPVARKTNEYLLANSLGNRYRSAYSTTTQYLILHATGSTANRIEKRYNSGGGFPFDNDLHLIITDYDGSELASGINAYADDVITPVPESTSANLGTYVNTPPFDVAIFQGFAGAVSGTDFQGFIYETHIFNKVLSPTERQTAKEILEQYYTFS